MSSQGPPSDSPPDSARQRLLGDVIAHLTAHGIGDVSLRQLATAIGTSHRMLIYHFGSRDGLLVEVVRAMEEQQRAAFAEMRREPATSAAELGRRMWRQLRQPELAPFERLFFEIYTQALQGRAYAQPLLDGVVDDWLGPMTDFLTRDGLEPTAARAQARLSLAATRGLLLDLLATGDQEGVDQAMEHMLTLFTHLTRSGDREPR
ncbi:DNA-binding transcriptional regulator, AcrR family [Parafrankia irregularis]|uniref:DNA-binding transcriptional regulator, AcrR family n=1 Tax=Parafrankia irregularis TaxID=795642 RepID=A0A0S4QXG3_9ACTN|nr:MULTISPECIES: TetR family transcriptional regulator [Parafrankia]MBE3201432.1 TetR/AcrR family transcriptional regulator [Parafrankia sp. CH37]CUU60305.1 DNA-binding transcriptional regulator, AcrR family [Parafrankia irregularis]